MNKKKILMLTILAIFIVGIAMGSVSATHTIKAGKFKAKISNSEYNKNMLIKKVTGIVVKLLKPSIYHIPQHIIKRLLKELELSCMLIDRDIGMSGM